MSSHNKKHGNGGIRKYQSKSKQQELDRKQLLEAQQQRVAARFPTKIKLNTEQRIDRLEALSATYLAFMDRMLELWESRKCPFVDEQDLPEPDKQQAQPAITTTEPAGKPQDDNNNNVGHSNHSPYH